MGKWMECKVAANLTDFAIFALSSVQFSSVAQSCPTFMTPWIAACQASLSITNSLSLLKLMSIELVMPSSHLILCHPFSSCPQSFLASGSFPMSQLFAWGGQSVKSFSFSISRSNEHPGLISFRMDWLDLLAVQGTLKSLLQHHSSKHQFFSAHTSLWPHSHIHKWLLERPQLD